MDKLIICPVNYRKTTKLTSIFCWILIRMHALHQQHLAVINNYPKS
ncbi:hypothetical protein PSM_A0822 [Pseudoalteromonas sp. SM9913]|nr:hypothetical protein PSM_A0822 [Pseudoalteromonas sp. SM9913]